MLARSYTPILWQCFNSSTYFGGCALGVSSGRPRDKGRQARRAALSHSDIIKSVGYAERLVAVPQVEALARLAAQIALKNLVKKGCVCGGVWVCVGVGGMEGDRGVRRTEGGVNGGGSICVLTQQSQPACDSFLQIQRCGSCHRYARGCKWGGVKKSHRYPCAAGQRRVRAEAERACGTFFQWWSGSTGAVEDLMERRVHLQKRRRYEPTTMRGLERNKLKSLTAAIDHY
ncbi:hypothetical protein T492DRAFT_13494 [Pavlovales sp. CCMP2436]|nr:hypothetical protein T492DRAFT_13494 [Pavlovales sp. CCMP2436]